MSNSQGALTDLTVLDLCDEKGQYMGKLLGEMGARVVKIEPPGGDAARNTLPFRNDEPDPNQSLHFWAFNIRQGGCDPRPTAALKGQAILKKLVEKADVLLESFDPGYMDSLGLGYSRP